MSRYDAALSHTTQKEASIHENWFFCNKLTSTVPNKRLKYGTILFADCPGTSVRGTAVLPRACFLYRVDAESSGHKVFFLLSAQVNLLSYLN